MSKDLLNISVNIAGRSYRMKVPPNEEKIVRDAANMINNKIAEYQQSYDANDRQDYLAMVTLLYTTEYLKKESAQETISDVVQQSIVDIETELEEIDTSS